MCDPARRRPPMNPARACSLWNAVTRPMLECFGVHTVQASARFTLAKPNVRFEPPRDAGRARCGKQVVTNGDFRSPLTTALRRPDATAQTQWTKLWQREKLGSPKEPGFRSRGSLGQVQESLIHYKAARGGMALASRRALATCPAPAFTNLCKRCIDGIRPQRLERFRFPRKKSPAPCGAGLVGGRGWPGWEQPNVSPDWRRRCCSPERPHCA